jgi:sec-independent protein translocase protein TatA
MSFGFKELLLIVIIIFIIFGAGKLPSVMKDIGRGLKSFRKGYKEDKEDK